MVGEERESSGAAAAAAAAAAETGGGGGKKAGGKGGSAEGMRKGPWTPAEDEVLLEHVRRHGEGNWNAVQRLSGLARCGKSCRLRWANHLRPNLKKGSFSPEEEFVILRLHAQLGNKWARMAAQLPGRTDNEIKNYWNTRLKRRQRAGLPIYPPELQDAIRFGRRLQHQNQASQGTPLTLLSASSYHAHQLPPLQLPPLLDLVSFCPQPEMTAPPTSHPCQLSFAFPVPSLSPPTTPTSSLLPKPQMGLCNYDLNPPPLMSPPYVVKMELPSNQLYQEAAGGGGGGGGGGPRNCGLTEPLLQEPQLLGLEHTKAGELLSLPAADDQAVRWGNIFCAGDYECSSSLAGTKETPLQFDFGTKGNGEALGNRMKDMADFLDLPAPVVLNWCNSDNAELPSAQPSDIVSEEVEIDMQQLAPPQDWNVNSWPWSNMPGIC